MPITLVKNIRYDVIVGSGQYLKFLLEKRLGERLDEKQRNKFEFRWVC